VVFLLTSSRQEATNLKKLLETSLYKFLVSEFKSSATNSKTLLARFPLLDLSQAWTDEKVFNHFQISKKERGYILDNIK